MYIFSVYYLEVFRYNTTEVITMFKISKPEYVNKTFRMPKELVSELEKLAQEQEISLNQLVIQCCQYALEHLDKD